MFELKKYHVINFFVVLILLWILRMVLPGVIYIFIPLFVFFIIASIFFFRNSILKKSFIIQFLKTFTPLFILLFFYLIGVILSFNIYNKNISDLFEYGVLITFFYIFFNIIYYEKAAITINIVFKKLVNLIAFSSVIVAALGLLKFYLQSINIDFDIGSPIGTSLNNDKNFYALFSFLGIFCFLPKMNKRNVLLNQLLIQVAIFILCLNILLSFSYRAVLFLPVYFMFIIYSQFAFTFFKENEKYAHLARNSRLFILFIILFISYTYFGSNTSKMEFMEYYFDENFNERSMVDFNLNKWKYSYEYYSNLSFSEKIFGGGFDYLKDFGIKFYLDENKEDYPHNPILSALLYSGLFGALFALIFIFISVYYSVIYFKKYILFSLMLLTSLAFVFFSGNSLFSVPIFIFLFSLSFLIRHQEITDLNIEFNIYKPGSQLLKETMDYVASSILLIFLLPLYFIISIIIFLSMGWPVFYSQIRVGQNGKVFKLYKFRTMNKELSMTSIAASEKKRISKIGAVLRRNKIDEIPELINIIRGDMSFVGPRPDVPGYADKLVDKDRDILELKPGLTGPASLKYYNEEEILSKHKDPQAYNDEVVFPDKVRINLAYMKNWSLWLDIKIIIFTIFKRKLKEEYFQ